MLKMVSPVGMLRRIMGMPAVATAGSTLLSLLILLVELKTGPGIRLLVLTVFPVAVVSWFGGFAAGQILAAGIPAAWLVYVIFASGQSWPLADSIVSAAILAAALSTISVLLHLIKSQRTQIRILRGFLPICSFCKKIRTDGGKWEQMESYITRNSEAKFSHSLCPQCREKEYGYLSERGAEDGEPGAG